MASQRKTHEGKIKYINLNIMIIESQVVYYARGINFLIPNMHNDLAKKILSWPLNITTTKSQRPEYKTKPTP